MDRVLAEAGSYFNLPARKEGIIPGAANLRLPRLVGDRLARQGIMFDRQFPADSPEGRLLCDEVVPVGDMDAAIARAVESLTSSGVVSAAANRKALRVGVPVGLQMGAEVGVFALVGLLAGRLGAGSLAGHQISISLASFTFCWAVGVGQAGSVRVGWAIGGRDTKAARRAGLVAFAGGAGVMSVFALSFCLLPEHLARMLSDQPEVIAASIPLLAVCAVFQLSDGIQAVGAGVLRGAGDTMYPFLANLVGHYFVGLPVAIALGIFMGRGLIGLWWGLCAGLTAVAVALLSRFLRLSAREIVPLEAHPQVPSQG
jgi:Na+-driven multidrug efflux pump